MPGQFEIYKDVGGQYRFRLKGRNGRSSPRASPTPPSRRRRRVSRRSSEPPTEPRSWTSPRSDAEVAGSVEQRRTEPSSSETSLGFHPARA
jgi:hypothetical protein